MSRSIDDDALSPYAKYETFKKAFETVKFFSESGNMIGAFVLSFSILEDRLCASLVVCSRALSYDINADKVSRMPFGQRIDHLLAMKAIENELHHKLQNAAYLRNDLTHKMMWRLDVFHANHIKTFRGLINELQKVQRRHEKLIKNSE